MNAVGADNLRDVPGILMTCSTDQNHRCSQFFLLRYHSSWTSPEKPLCFIPAENTAIDFIMNVHVDLK
jgi:hypothetical protein